MAAPNYTTDLTTLAIGSITVDAGTWDESSNAGWDTAGTMVDDANLYYNGTACVSAQYTKDGSGTGNTGPGTIMYNHTSTFTVPADGAALIHHMWAAPPALKTLAAGGVKILIGNDFGNFDAWNCSGSDFAPAPRGGWANYAINPAIGGHDNRVGVGSASPYTMVGVSVGATAQARGNPNACNAVRYGRCESVFTGGDLANGYATFNGFGLVDDTPTNKWNLIEPVEGGYKIQGLVSLGTAATPVDFRDQNTSITVRNTINVTSPFNRVEVNNAASYVEWTAISITALGTVSKGQFEVINNATVNKDSCTFTDMDSFKYLSNSTITTTTYRRCGLITQNSATFTDCIFDKPSGAYAVYVTDFSVLNGNTFNSSGASYALANTSPITTTTFTWNNQESGYVAGVSGDDVGVAPTGNETIVLNVAAGHTVTINVADGASIPSVANAGTGVVDVVAGQKTLQFTVAPLPSPDYEWRLYTVTAEGSLLGAIELAGVEHEATATQSYTHSYTSQPVAIQIISNDYEEETYYKTLEAADFSTTINLTLDDND